jgi:tRNA (guanine37-N1)-methyltransferase
MTPFHFHFVTLFPETIASWLTTSIIGRAFERGLFRYTLYQLRDFSKDKHRSVDDVSYGGGGGMVLRLEPLVAALEHIREQISPNAATVIAFSPHGDRIQQSLLDSLTATAQPRHLILVCGHYEGVDQRFIDGWVDRQISLGDFIVTGGELPALALTDALIRQTEGALGGESAALKESFRLQTSAGQTLLEHPHYTRPPEFRGVKVPEILLSGDHNKIAEWRHARALELTQRLRPDLLAPTNQILTKTEDRE